MKCHQPSLWNFGWVVLQLLSATFVLPSTIAFVDKRNNFARIHRIHPWAEEGFRCGSIIHSTPNDDWSGTPQERQDAYGRSLPSDGDSHGETDGHQEPMNLDPLVVCGPSGVGKGTVIESLRNRFAPNAFGFSVSHTTRQPRPGEVHGEHYYFTTIEQIQKDIAAGLFVEHAQVHGNYYGTSKQAIDSLKSEEKITILDIDVQGVKAVKESGIPAKYVFIAPPSMEALEGRLRGRGTETEEAIAKRLGNAAAEIDYGSQPGNFDHVFVNDHVEGTVDEMVQVLVEWYPQLKFAIREETTNANPPPSDYDFMGEVDKMIDYLTDRTGKQANLPPDLPEEPYDFLGESDKMIRHPGVNKRHSGCYTVDLEEPEGPRGYPKLGKTNPTIENNFSDKNNKTTKNSNTSSGLTKKTAMFEQHYRTKILPDPNFDFMAQSERMMRFPSVRKGHGFMLEATQTNENSEDENGQEEEAGFRPKRQRRFRGYPKFDNTNPSHPEGFNAY